RAAVHPADDGGDFLVAQRSIVLVFADADGLVEMPRRHLPVGDALADRSRPRPHLVVGDEGHRRRGALVMAGLAALLKKRRNILVEGWGRLLIVDCRLRINSRSRARGSACHGDLYLRIGPAAVIAEVAG